MPYEKGNNFSRTGVQPVTVFCIPKCKEVLGTGHYRAPGMPKDFEEAVKKRSKDIIVKILKLGESFEI